MEYAAFKAATEQAGEALGRGDLSPQLARLWFDGTTVSAWDDNVAISVACPFEFDGGVLGELLTKLIGRATGKEVAVTTKGGTAIFKVGRSSLKLTVEPLEQRSFEMRDPDRAAAIAVEAKLLKPALGQILKCVGQSLEKPEYHGITFAVDGNDLLIYAGQPQVLAEAAVPLKSKPKSKFNYVVLPEKFCRQLVKHYDEKDSELTLYNATDTIGGGLLVCPTLTVFGRSLSSGRQKLDMRAYIDSHVKQAPAWFPIPKGLAGMLDRASLFEGEHHNLELAVEAVSGGVRLRITIEDGEAQLVDVSGTIKGEVEPVVVKTNAKHLRTGADLIEMCVDSKRIIMRDDQGDDGVCITQVASVIAV